MQTFSRGTINRLYAPTHEQIDKLDRFFLEKDIENLQKRMYDGPSKYYLDGPGNCNYQMCGSRSLKTKSKKKRASRLQGCGEDCTCINYGWYGWRCIPNCCIRANNSKPCAIEHPGQTIQCALPCHYYPNDCHEYAYNPYHTFQGGYKVSPNYPGIVPTGD